jgi:beta-phosphoglucomutase-like phosphatase (HAD superfamily)
LNGVVFDFDGVLADSEPLSWRAWAVVLEPFGVAVVDEDVAACTGTTSRDTYEHFASRAEIPAYPDVLAAVDAHRQAAFQTDLRGFDDAIDTVRRLAMVGVPLGVASSSSRANLDMKMKVLDVARYFEVTVAGDEVERGKPAPDLYEVAVERMRIEPGASVAVEDTLIGADAAAAAGLRTVIVDRSGMPTGRHPVVSAVDADLLLLWLGRL